MARHTQGLLDVSDFALIIPLPIQPRTEADTSFPSSRSAVESAVTKRVRPMPSADQIKALLKAYAQGNDAQFQSVAMQIAAGEARQGHGKLTEELKALIDQAKIKLPHSGTTPIPMARPRGEVAELLSVGYPNVRLKDLIFAPRLRNA